MPRTLPSMAGVATLIDLGQLSGLIFLDNNHFEEVIVCSNREKSVLKHRRDENRNIIGTNPYWGQKIEKVYDMIVRNNFSFRNSVENDLARRGELEAPVEVASRTWGRHLGGCKGNSVPRTPFVIHENEEDGLRLHVHFKPSGRLEIDGETGYYVDGDKIDDSTIEPFVKNYSKVKTAEEQSRERNHPVNARLHNILYIRISGQWYRLKTPTQEEIETLAETAEEWADGQCQAG